MRNAETGVFIPENRTNNLTRRTSFSYARERGNFMPVETAEVPIVTFAQEVAAREKAQAEKVKTQEKAKKPIEPKVLGERRKAAMIWAKYLAETGRRMDPKMVEQMIREGKSPGSKDAKQNPQEQPPQQLSQAQEAQLRVEWTAFQKTGNALDEKAVARFISEGVSPAHVLAIDGGVIADKDVGMVHGMLGGVYGQEGIPYEIPVELRKQIVERIATGESATEAVALVIEANLRAQWEEALGAPWEKLPQDERVTVQFAINEGLAPQTISSKGRNEITAKQVLENAKLSDEDRLEEAARLLGRELSLVEQDAILAAHYVGVDRETGEKELGKDEEHTVGVFNKKLSQMDRTKVELEKAIDPLTGKPYFSLEDQRVLIEAGIAALKADVTGIAGAAPQLAAVRTELERTVDKNGDGNNLPSPFIREQVERVRRIIDTNPGNAGVLTEGLEMLNVLADWQNASQTAEQKAKEDAEAGRGGLTPELRTFTETYKTDADIKALKDAAPGTPERAKYDAAIAAINKELEGKSLEDYRFPDDLLALAARFQEIREKLISQVLFKPYIASDRNDRYDLPSRLQSEPRIQQLIDATVNDRIAFEDDPPGTPGGKTAAEKAADRRDELSKFSSAVGGFYNMNAAILKGQFRDLIIGGGNIDYTHFEVMLRVTGVGPAMRLYEQKYQEMLARAQFISTKAYDQIVLEVRQDLLKLNESGLLKSRYGDKSLEPWEIDQALYVARSYYNITFRAAEKIGSGQFPRTPGKGGERKYGGFAQEEAARVMNWMELFAKRFDLGDSMGKGFVEDVKKNYLEYQKTKGNRLGKNKIVEFGGMNVKDLEVAGMFQVSGIWGGWRNETMAFPVIRFKDEDGHMTNLRHWLDHEHGGQTRAEHIHHIREHADPSHGATKADVAHASHELVKLLAPIIKNMEGGFGPLIGNGMVEGAVGYETRVLIWERVAETNTPLMVNYLQGLRMEKGSGIASLEEILAATGEMDKWGVEKRKEKDPEDDKKTVDVIRFKIDHHNPLGRVGSAAWQTLQDKMLYHHELRLRGQREGVVLAPEPLMIYSPDEQLVIDAITAEGEKLAPHLADVMFPQTATLNDMPFEVLDTKEAGDTFFKRKMGDIGSFSEAQNAAIGMMINPGGMTDESALEALQKVEEGVAGPNGHGAGQDAVFPLVDTWIDFVMTESGQRWLPWNSVKELFQKPTSKAQKYAGHQAMSLNEGAAKHLLHTANKLGILDHHRVQDLEKKRGLGILGMLWAIVRDVGPFGVLAVMNEIATESLSDTGVVSASGGGVHH